jgi:predicted component of viral defense system (DUF524 family)
MSTNELVPAGQAQVTPDVAERGRIAIYDGPVTRVADAHRSTIAPASHVLHEWHEYRVTCHGAEWLEVGSEWVAAFGSGSGAFRVQFANQVGLARIRALDAHGATIDTRHVEVVSPKLGQLDASLAFLRAILADLTSERGAMAYLPRAQTARTVRNVHRPPSLLIQYFYLLNNAEDIAEARDLILRNPHRVLDDETEHVSVFDLTEIDADVVLQLVQGDARFDRSASPPRLTAAPDGVWFRMPREGFDSAENQFVKAVAGEMADACEQVLRAPWLRNIDDAGVVHRRETLSRLHGRLHQFVRAPMFDQVRPMHRVPASSRVLQRRAGYRELNGHWQDFLQARDPVWQRMQHAIDLRDIATLYEYWVWFALCREVRDAYGCERPEVDAIPSSEPGLPQGLRARFRNLGTLSYNATRRTYSGISLRPDYLWEPVIGSKVGFDAKFRLAWDTAPLDIADDELASDPIARVKADDLVKMHAYRDAIPGIRAAVVLYPGHVAQFRTVERVSLGAVTVGDVLHGELAGVGAIPMSPLGGDEDE